MLPTLLVVMLLLSGIPGAFASSGVVLDTQQVFEPSPGANRRFGHSVAVDGDTAVIGAVGATTSAGANRGAAYVYVRTLSGWQHQATLAADDGQSGDYFGSTVVIEGDTIVVSAIYADPRGNNSGAAYVFTRSGTAWTQRAKLVPSDSAADDYCGGALAISGPMVFVGSGRHNGFRGAVWLFTEAGGSWTETRKFSEDIAEQSRFGDAIAISGSRLLIAAPWESLDGLDRAGKVYTYRLGTSGWASGGTIAPDTPVADGRFGAALAFDGTRAAVGFPGWSSSVGAVHVFDPPATALGTRWVRTQTITRTEPVEEFGQAVKLAGGRMLVDESAQGRVFSYTADDGSTWIPEATIDGLGPVDRCALGGDTALLSISTDDTHGSASGTAHFVTLRAMPPALPGGAHRVAGLNRYLTSVAASKRAFLSASTVVVATGDNWPDALGGSALAGAVEGPLLLTSSASLPSGVRDEIVRLKAKKVYVLGGKAAVSDTVLNQIKGIPGVTSVERVSGNDRYGTARAIADKAIAELNARGTYSGGALVATGGNFPDATAASPLAASLGWPILLVNPANGSVYVPSSTTSALILGGTGVVSASVESALKSRLGTASVDRAGGANRYETAAKIADKGVAAGMRWNGVGVATGENFPDALAGGAMLGAFDSVMLLTPGSALDTYARGRLQANAAQIRTLHVVGGTTVVSDPTMAAAKSAAGM